MMDDASSSMQLFSRTYFSSFCGHSSHKISVDLDQLPGVRHNIHNIQIFSIMEIFKATLLKAPIYANVNHLFENFELAS